ncbi:MAG: I78 family peptidase inhibitor [Pseudotabrizicola sp.]|uniref:I78 family peptidase inhibitor n=1 Tax=Pseudotabrizicola sp. TaxID=2939647 RepID=UPI00271FB7B3|nr:I78 family peptidase inhibitor [Pseudotabrizicola sp.]MDO8883497.1 I78 family peptidase inhibitor [Pseudotabrizicola sp.]MDP2081847.1 I78 family peptidase inhibitor [Pseudotabrizicola sp.]MDZ7573863.1 I78 family peptidase inhibitor [Pseudotabrizicola sp.]
MKQIALAGCVVAMLAACQPVVSDGPDLATCGADALQGLVGQPASVLQTMRFGQETRIIRPDMAVTMDYRPDRLNIEIDRAERISRVHCS